MVNTGGPSKGCMTCIKRKIRCDRERPSCTQCRHSRRQCEGYRDLNRLIFRDQSQTTVERAQKPRRSSGSRRTSPTANAGADAQIQPGSNTSLTNRTPTLDEDSSLIAFFLNNFTCRETSESRSNLFWVPGHFDELMKINSTRLSVQCAAAMSLARLKRSPQYLRLAQEKYSLALLVLANAWRLGRGIRGEADFMAIFFLAFFEVSAAYDPSFRQSWMTHLLGLGSLFEQCQDPCSDTLFGARMFLQSRAHVVLIALQTRTSVTDAFLKSDSRYLPLIPPGFEPALDCEDLLIRVAELQAQHYSAGPSRSLTARLIALDGEMRVWMENMPPSWKFRKCDNSYDSGVWWDVRRDVYLAKILAFVWNKARAARIIVHDLIKMSIQPLGIVESGAAAETTYYRGLVPEICKIVVDVCATIPLYYRPIGLSTGDPEQDNPPQLGNAYWLVWTLEIIGSMRDAPHDLQAWMLACLDRIHTTTGVKQAELAATAVRSKIMNEDRLVIEDAQ